jgi:hypothetical protein
VTTTERIGDHELGAQQPDAVDRHRRDLFSPFGESEVDVELGGCDRGVDLAGPFVIAVSPTRGAATPVMEPETVPRMTVPAEPSTVTTSPPEMVVVAPRAPPTARRARGWRSPHDK